MKSSVDDQLLIVQFLHPGGEHRPDDGLLKTWNTGPHKRKFLVGGGRWRTATDSVDQVSQIVFWGEWEPPSQIAARYESSDRAWPNYLHTPLWTTAPPDGSLQNTDPYVYGDHFRYSNCLQTTVHGPTGLQNLAPGSVILFGSGIADEFALDTVLVVADSEPMSRSMVPSDAKGDAFRSVVHDVLYRENRDLETRLYHGATPSERVGQMFSFFPTLPLEAAPHGFPRPTIIFPSIINPRLRQGRKHTLAKSIDECHHMWDAIATQVVEQGLALGTQVDTPQRVEADEFASGQ